MTAEEHEDTKRLKFMAKGLREAIIHIAIRNERNIIQMYTRPSDWAELSAPDPSKFDLDDLRMLLDLAMTQAEAKK